MVCNAGDLAEDWGWNEEAVKEFIRRMEVQRVLSVTSNRKFGILSIHPEYVQP
jgi:hypothetical protein